MHRLSICIKKILPDCPHLSLKIPGAVAISCPRCCPKTWPPSGRHWDILLPKINKKSQHKNIRTVAVEAGCTILCCCPRAITRGKRLIYPSILNLWPLPFILTGSFKRKYLVYTLHYTQIVFFQRLFSEQNHFLHEICMTNMQKKVFF